MSANAQTLASSSYAGAGRNTHRVAPNGVVGMLLFIATEVMFFSALISAFVIAKSSMETWPPPDQPRLEVTVTAVNTVFLLLSGVLLFFSNRAFRAGRAKQTDRLLLASVLLGTTFVVVQGYEWSQLLYHGLTMTSSSYGSFFYLIVGMHAAHAVIALALLLRLYVRLRRRTLPAHAFWTAQAFWYFVVGVWPFLYANVYFN